MKKMFHVFKDFKPLVFGSLLEIFTAGRNSRAKLFCIYITSTFISNSFVLGFINVVDSD